MIALRKGFHLLVDHALAWVGSCLLWKAWESDHVYQLWVLLGLPPSLCQELVDLELRWASGALGVHPRRRGELGTMKRIEVALLATWEF